jgi:hypothetical protein
MKLRVLAVLTAALAGARPFPASAHDVPAGVTVWAFLKPEGQRLHLLVRAPLGALRDVDFPTRGPGYLDLARADASLRTGANLWIADEVAMYEGDARLPAPRIASVRVSLPSDRSFATWEEAQAHLSAAPLPQDTELFWSQAMLDVWFEYAIQSPASAFSIRPGLGRLGQRVVTSLRFLPPGGAVRAFELSGDPGLVRLDPRWYQAALRFVELGFFHILDGIDHLLFLFCLVLPFRRPRALVLVVTSFTVAHSVTLIASAFGLAPDAPWFPLLVETLIAGSIVYMALENIVAPRLRRRWLITFAFGLVHGFGFSFGLQQTLQFAGSHLLTSLVSFNVGIELGQLLVLALALPLLDLAFRSGVPERIGTIIVSALVAHTAWHWLIARADALRQFPFPWPDPSAAWLAGAMRWLILAVIAVGLVWLVFGLLLPSARRPTEKEAE